MNFLNGAPDTMAPAATPEYPDLGDFVSNEDEKTDLEEVVEPMAEVRH